MDPDEGSKIALASARKALSGGAASIAKAVKDSQAAQKAMEESKRHNQKMEEIALKQGKGLYLKPYKKDLGLYLMNDTKN